MNSSELLTLPSPENLSTTGTGFKFYYCRQNSNIFTMILVFLEIDEKPLRENKSVIRKGVSSFTVRSQSGPGITAIDLITSRRITKMGL